MSVLFNLSGTSGNGTNLFKIELIVNINSIGVSATVIGNSYMVNGGTTGIATVSSNLTYMGTTTINTTTVNYINIMYTTTIQNLGIGSSNTTFEQSIIEKIGA